MNADTVTRLDDHDTSRTYRSFLPYAHKQELRMYSKLFYSFLVITLAALFAAQSVEAVKGPRITNKVYFDIQHGDEKLGRSTFLVFHCQTFAKTIRFSHYGSIWWSKL